MTHRLQQQTVHEDSRAHRVMSSSLTMEAEAVTYAIQWLAFQRDTQITHAIILTDSMNLLQKVESGKSCPNWYTAMQGLRLLGRAEVLRCLRNFLNMDRPEHHSIDRLKERRSGERKQPTFHPPRSRTICVQPDEYWHCFESNLWETTQRQGRARMGLSEHYDAILS